MKLFLLTVIVIACLQDSFRQVTEAYLETSLDGTFCKNAPSQMFGKVLNTPESKASVPGRNETLNPEAYLKTGQASTTEFFFENSSVVDNQLGSNTRL